MIRLMIPQVPPIEDIACAYSKAYEDGVHANFGAIFYDAVRFLSDLSNRECLPISSGTAAIEVACRMTFKPGSCILVPDYTHAGTLQAIYAANCNPVLVETDALTWTISEKAILRYAHKAQGVVAVSPFGYPVNVKTIDSLCKKLGLPIVYDFAGAWGDFPKTPNIVCYSLHATKNFSCGEGGVISLKSRQEWERARWFTNFCNDQDRVVRSLQGRNYKPSELLCAVIMAHKKAYNKIEEIILEKRKAIDSYVNTLGVTAPVGGSPSLCVVEGITSLESEKLNAMGIENKQYYPYFEDSICFVKSRTPKEKVLLRHALPYQKYKEVIKCLTSLRQKN